MTTPAVYDNSVRIGYARVSTRTQDHQAQLEALTAAHRRAAAAMSEAAALADSVAGRVISSYIPTLTALTRARTLTRLRQAFPGEPLLWAPYIHSAPKPPTTSRHVSRRTGSRVRLTRPAPRPRPAVQ